MPIDRIKVYLLVCQDLRTFVRITKRALPIWSKDKIRGIRRHQLEIPLFSLTKDRLPNEVRSLLDFFKYSGDVFAEQTDSKHDG